MNLLFIFVALLHISIWIFVVFAFLNKKTAYFNLYYLIPMIYILHILPFHILCTIEKKIYPNNCDEKFNIIKKITMIGYLYEIIKKKLSFSLFNPLSPQVMLVLGAITSSYKLKNNLLHL